MLTKNAFRSFLSASLFESGIYFGGSVLLQQSNKNYNKNLFPIDKSVKLKVLKVIMEAIPIQEATVMAPSEDYKPEIHYEYRTMLGENISLLNIERWAFYDKIKSPDTSLIIATGEQRRFANLLLTNGKIRLSSK